MLTKYEDKQKKASVSHGLTILCEAKQISREIDINRVVPTATLHSNKQNMYKDSLITVLV